MLTILVAVYGTERYLPRMLQSLRDQTCRPDHVLLCDDGGDVDFEPMIAPFRDQFSIDVVRHDQNRGTYAARRTLLASSRTEFVSFVDPDDQLHPQAVEFWQRAATATGADIIAANLHRRTVEAGLSAARDFEEAQLCVLSRDEALWACFDIAGGQAERLRFFSCGGKMFRRSCLGDGAALAGDMGHLLFAEDSLLALAAIMQGQKVAHLDLDLYDHIERPESSSRQKGLPVADRFLQDTGRVVTRMAELLEADTAGCAGLVVECERLRSHFGRLALRERLGVRGAMDAKLDELIKTAPEAVAKAAKEFRNSGQRAGFAPLPMLRLENKDLVSAPDVTDYSDLNGARQTAASAG